jgi:hypothetical protein
MQEKSLIKRNILKYLDYKGLSRYQFYKITGITRGILDQNNGMSEENTAKFLAVFKEVSVEWLITNKGQMLNDGSLNETNPSQVTDSTISYSCKKCKEKDKLLKAQQETIDSQHKLIYRLEEDLEETKKPDNIGQKRKAG